MTNLVIIKLKFSNKKNIATEAFVNDIALLKQ